MAQHHLKEPSKKLANKQIGPYEKIEIISPNAVKLKLPRGLTIHPVVNVSSICPYRAPTIKGQKADEPGPIEVQGQEEYEVESILDSRRYRRKLQFLVKWKGYTSEHNSWEPEDNLKNAQSQIKKFYKENSGAVRRIREDVFEAIPWRKIENFTDGKQDRKRVIFNWLDVHPEE